MGTLAGILATTALSHLGGHLAGGLLGRFGLAGFGPQLKVASYVLKVGKALRAVYDHDPSAKAREDLKRWLSEHDPKNESGLGQGVL